MHDGVLAYSTRGLGVIDCHGWLFFFSFFPYSFSCLQKSIFNIDLTVHGPLRGCAFLVQAGESGICVYIEASMDYCSPCKYNPAYRIWHI